MPARSEPSLCFRQHMDDLDFKHRRHLRRYVSRFLHRSEDVEDIVQESFLKIIEESSKRTIEHPKSYLFRTARNLAFNAKAKKSYKLEDLTDSSDLIKSTRLENDVVGRERLQLFCHAVSELPEKCRQVLILRKVYGYTQKEVARKLGIAVSTVEKHQVKALVRCSQFMKDHGYSDEGG